MKKTSILILVIGLIFVVGFVGYILFTQLGLGVKQGTAEGTTITSLHLESFPEGTQLGAGMTGTETTVFKMGEIAVVSAEITTDGSVTATIGIYQNGTFVLGQPCVEIKGSGGFGCSLGYPQTSGNYTLKVYIDETEKKSMNFEVIQ